MAKTYKGGGKLVTRLLGRCEIFHGNGIVEFRMRSEDDIAKRGMKTVLRITGLPDIPRLENGVGICLDLTDLTDLLEGSNVLQFKKNEEFKKDGEVPAYRPERRTGIA